MIPDTTSSRKQRFATFLIHFICIGMLFVLPEVISSLNRPSRDITWKFAMYGKSFLYVAVFYINYCFIIGKSIRPHSRWVRFFAYNLVVIAVSLVIVFSMWRVMMLSGRHRDSFVNLGLWEQFVHCIPWLVRDVVMLVLTIALSVALKLSDRWMQIERDRRELQSIRREEELSSLKSQLNPHFLFNTLNAIYALIAISPDKAQEAVHELSRLLRYVLYENPESVTLSQETDFVKNYVTLMKLRMGDTPVSLTIDCPDAASTYVPPLVFIAIVENAFKHGNTGNPDDTISIAITSRDNTVTCVTVNSYDPRRRTMSAGAGGIGLSNLRRRLQLIYGDCASLTTADDGTTFRVDLTIKDISHNSTLSCQ